jgi:phosphoglycolate phosphatase-like HAD superfamily hydrolase
MTHRAKRLLLWDIDGTLVNTGGAGVESLKRMVRERFGRDDDLHDIEIAGKTDRAILRDILRKYEVEPTDEKVREFADDYVAGLADELPRRTGRVLPGIVELLAQTHEQPHIVNALLTGNLQRGAQIKLEHYRLWHFFAFGAFADDHHDRNELGAFAISRARETTGEQFAPEQIDVIGDTGHDIACGKAFGARTVAVATGNWSRERLAACKPDFLFDDFSAVDQVSATLDW